jgi:hypothetical protein
MSERRERMLPFFHSVLAPDLPISIRIHQLDQSLDIALRQFHIRRADLLDDVAKFRDAHTAIAVLVERAEDALHLTKLQTTTEVRVVQVGVVRLPLVEVDHAAAENQEEKRNSVSRKIIDF